MHHVDVKLLNVMRLACRTPYCPTGGDIGNIRYFQFGNSKQNQAGQFPTCTAAKNKR